MPVTDTQAGTGRSQSVTHYAVGRAASSQTGFKTSHDMTGGSGWRGLARRALGWRYMGAACGFG